MSEDNKATPSRDQLREEAADWFSLMRGPEAEARRADFNAWMALSPDHRRAYNSVAETFSMTRGLKRPTLQALPENRAPRRIKTRAALILAAMIISLPVGWYIWSKHQDAAQSPPLSTITAADREARFATSVGEIRNVVLIDGSRLTLDTNSIVLASYTTGERGLRLVQGRARFDVAHDARPFVVRADTSVVTAHSTTFDVTMIHDRQVKVHLLKGSVDVQSQTDPVAAANGPKQSPHPITMHLEDGQQLSIEAHQLVMSRLAVQSDESWPDGVEAFNDVALSDLVAAANRYARRPIVIRDRQIGAMRISGTFHLTDTGALAHKVADLLHLSVVEDGQSYRLAYRLERR